jgi:hypothetical protein
MRVSDQLVTTAFLKRFEDKKFKAKNTKDAITELKSLISTTLKFTFELAKT